MNEIFAATIGYALGQSIWTFPLAYWAIPGERLRFTKLKLLQLFFISGLISGFIFIQVFGKDPSGSVQLLISVAISIGTAVAVVFAAARINDDNLPPKSEDAN